MFKTRKQESYNINRCYTRHYTLSSRYTNIINKIDNPSTCTRYLSSHALLVRLIKVECIMRGSDRIRTYCVYPVGTVLQTVVAPPSLAALPFMWTWAESNHRRRDLQSLALPTELQVHRAKALLSWRVPPIEAHLIRPIPTRIS